jgi:hypothetical protein
MRMTTHLHLVPRLRMGGGISTRPGMPSWCVQGQFYFLDVFAKFRNATFSFVVSVRLNGTTRLPLDGFL